MCGVTRHCPRSMIDTVAQGWASGREMCIGKINASSLVRVCFGDVSEIALSRLGLIALVGQVP